MNHKQHRLEKLFFACAKNNPERLAVRDNENSVTYKELKYLVDKLSDELFKNGLQNGDTVVLLQEKSVAAIVSMLAVLSCGAVYVPLNTQDPELRIKKIIQIVEPVLIIYSPKQQRIAHAMKKVFSAGLVGLARNGELLAADSAKHEMLPKHAKETKDDNFQLAYILFTSGSTGTPKGVPIRHNSILQLVNWSINYFNITSDDKLSCHAPFFFDVSVWDIYTALLTGAELILVHHETNVLPNLLSDFIRDQQITIWRSVPVVLRAMAQFKLFNNGDFPKLRHVCWYGEVFPIPTLIQWMTKLSHVTFTNTYGPTEATIVCSFYQMKSIPSINTEMIPIGIPIPETPLLVLGENNKVINDGSIGELCVGGISLSPGYWKDEDTTKKSFIQILNKKGIWYKTGDLAKMDKNGVFYFHGRINRQIKATGYRIELDEIENALNQLNDVAVGAVVAYPVESLESMRICAACQMKTGVLFDVVSLKCQLAKLLPSYMLPRKWLQIKEIPYNQNGKIDYHMITKVFEQ